LICFLTLLFFTHSPIVGQITTTTPLPYFDAPMRNIAIKVSERFIMMILSNCKTPGRRFLRIVSHIGGQAHSFFFLVICAWDRFPEHYSGGACLAMVEG
jgi:hypothetical protein